jgi:hypothetical protein
MKLARHKYGERSRVCLASQDQKLWIFVRPRRFDRLRQAASAKFYSHYLSIEIRTRGALPLRATGCRSAFRCACCGGGRREFRFRKFSASGGPAQRIHPAMTRQPLKAPSRLCSPARPCGPLSARRPQRPSSPPRLRSSGLHHRLWSASLRVKIASGGALRGARSRRGPLPNSRVDNLTLARLNPGAVPFGAAAQGCAARSRALPGSWNETMATSFFACTCCTSNNPKRKFSKSGSVARRHCCRS